MICIKEIIYDSKEYRDTLELRNKVMRIPLGLNIYDQDFSFEKNAYMIGAFDNNILIGCGTMTHIDDIYKLEYLCVDSDSQSKGTGYIMLEYLERYVYEHHGKKIILDARVSAKRFYERHGYLCVGDVFMLDYAPVEHIIMEKVID